MRRHGGWVLMRSDILYPYICLYLIFFTINICFKGTWLMLVFTLSFGVFLKYIEYTLFFVTVHRSPLIVVVWGISILYDRFVTFLFYANWVWYLCCDVFISTQKWLFFDITGIALFSPWLLSYLFHRAQAVFPEELGFL